MKKNGLLVLNATAVQMVLVLLVESGALYCILWVSQCLTSIITAFVARSHRSLTCNSSRLTAPWQILTMAFLLTGMENGFLTMASIMVPISVRILTQYSLRQCTGQTFWANIDLEQGIYPTIIIVLVCLQRAHKNTLDLDLHRYGSSTSSFFPTSHSTSANANEYEMRFSANVALPTTPRPTVNRLITNRIRRHSVPLQFDLPGGNRSNLNWPDITKDIPVEEK